MLHYSPMSLALDHSLISTQVSPHKMITTSVRGHLANYEFPPEYGWSKVDPIVLFDAPIETTYRDDLEPLQRMLSNLSTSCHVLILWLDCDREGEAIGAEVQEVCLESNPRLQVFRARFSTVMPNEIKKALQSLGRLNQYMVDAVVARSQMDLRVGAAFTRFQTLRLQRKFDALSEGVISYGPCQFPTLGFVVERWARIETFVPQDFWYIDLSIRVPSDEPAGAAAAAAGGSNADVERRNNGNNTNPRGREAGGRTITFSWKRGRLYDQLLTMALYESCLDVGEAVVTGLDGRPKNRWRPVPLATVELQKRASRFLKIGSETLMTAAEELYQQGYISYPRTETEKFRPEFQHRALIEQLSSVNGTDFGAYASKLLTGNHFQNPRAGQHDDQAHPPITPCKAVDPNTINDYNQRQIYILIVKHYLACCSRDAIGKETKLTVRMGTEEFNAMALMILEKNWLEIYHPWEGWSTGHGEFPPLQVGSRFVPSSLLMKEGTTTPPQPISEVELISLMDRNGIGTDATIAQHISTIQEREYATKDASQKFLPTPLGIALVEGYNSMGYQLNKPDLRREVEAECNLIAAGRKNKDDVIVRILTKMRECYQVATQEAQKLDEAVGRHFPRLGSNIENSTVVQNNFSECGTCGNTMDLKQERQARGGSGGGGGRNATRRKLLYCNTCRAGWNLPRGQAHPKRQGDNDNNQGLPVKCPICNFQVIKIMRGDGYEGNGYHVCPKCFSDPPSDHGGAPGGGDFRCFSCQHPACALASGIGGGDVEVFSSCPFCIQQLNRGGGANAGGKVALKKNSRGFVLSCTKYVSGQDRCPYTIWLPKECQTVSVRTANDENQQNSICATCSVQGRVVRLIHIVWKRGSVPPHMGRDITVCVLCDTGFRREMHIALPQPDQVQYRRRDHSATAANHNHRNAHRSAGNDGGRSNGDRGREGGGTGRGRGGAAGRGVNGGSGNSCYRCGQPGHFANSCPNG